MNQQILNDSQDVVYYVIKNGAKEITHKVTSKIVAEQMMTSLTGENLRVVAVNSHGQELLLG